MRPLVTGLVGIALAGSAFAQPAPAPTTGDPARAADVAQPRPSHADLAPAADVAPAAAAPPAKPSSDDIDLGELGLDPASPEAATDDKLTIYGFADFTYDSLHWSKNLGFIPQDSKTFEITNLDVYLAKNLTQRVRALTEVRFTFAPNGGQANDGSVVDTTATDPTNYSRPVQWGGIVIERAYVEYDVTDYLTIRAGHWLTPYGIWNIDHGSPVIISVGKPFIIGEQFFPEHQTGLDLFGSRSQGSFKLGYHLTASNGRGGAEAQQDQDSRFAFGGRLELETPWRLKAGGSYYRGRYTGLPKELGAQPESYLEASYGGDIQFDLGSLHAQAEVIVRERHYEEGSRVATPGGFAFDARDSGWYVLAGYRFNHLWNVMPFAFFEDYRPGDHSVYNHPVDLNLGFNFRPTASLVLKAMVSLFKTSANQGLFPDVFLREFLGQACWVF